VPILSGSEQVSPEPLSYPNDCDNAQPTPEEDARNGWKADINWGSSLAVKIDDAKIRAKFASSINMTADELEAWLATDESRAVGWKGPDGCRPESIGHASGRRIVRILRTPESGLAPDDYLHMRKVVGFIRRHRAQRPANPVTSRWRYSLMNWGHDPLKELSF
jgi:hypothetical protein